MRPTDPSIYVIVAVMLATIGLAAAVVPRTTRRACRSARKSSGDLLTQSTPESAQVIVLSGDLDWMAIGKVWFIACATGVTIVVIALVAANAAAEYRRLRRRGTPRPLYLMWQRSGARFVPSSPVQRRLEGRLVWIDWDIRWVTSGQTLARVVSSGVGNDLVLGLETPIVIEAQGSLPAVRLAVVTFIPSCSGVAPYEHCAVPGKLTPAIMPGLEATAQVVVYPAHPDPLGLSAGGA